MCRSCWVEAACEVNSCGPHNVWTRNVLFTSSPKCVTGRSAGLILLVVLSMLSDCLHEIISLIEGQRCWQVCATATLRLSRWAPPASHCQPNGTACTAFSHALLAVFCTRVLHQKHVWHGTAPTCDCSAQRRAANGHFQRTTYATNTLKRTGVERLASARSCCL